MREKILKVTYVIIIAIEIFSLAIKPLWWMDSTGVSLFYTVCFITCLIVAIMSVLLGSIEFGSGSKIIGILLLVLGAICLIDIYMRYLAMQ